MNAAEVLKVAQTAGVRIIVDGDDIVLDAATPPPAPVLEALKRHKAEIVALLTTHADYWSAQEWRAFFDERAGIAEFDAGLPRAEAEARALECCVVEWLNRNPEPSEPGRCARCGRAEGSGCAVIPFGTATHGHTWLHPQCWNEWHRNRRERATKALGRQGLTLPALRELSR